MPPKFIFIRHGEAEHNVAFHAVGDSAFTDEAHRDAPLTQKGIQQCQELAQALMPYKILDIWCSPLRRCKQTAEELFEELTINKIYLHDNLLERQGGGFVCNERKSKDELQEEGYLFDTGFLPDTPAVWKTRESSTVLIQRTKMLILQLADMYTNVDESYHIGIVGHGDALGFLLNRPFKNAEFVVLGIDELPRMLNVGPT
jgi:broad specificity phosphatase PhoE